MNQSNKAKAILFKFVFLPILIGVILSGGIIGYIAWSTHRATLEYSAMAQQLHPHPGDDVRALIDYMQSDEHSLKDRNHAVWALGRWSDSRALSALEAAYTGKPCDHDKQLCQYELRKAINRCGGNIPSPE